METRNNIYLFILLAFISLFINVGGYGVLETSDARYAEISREMYQSHDYLHPNFLGIHHYHKPPFTYWITTLGYKIFGINPFGARFFLQLAIILQMILVYKLYLLLFGSKKGAIWSMLIYFSFPMVLSSSRSLTTDPFLTVFVLISLVFWLNYKIKGKIVYFYIFTFSLALGMLTKGPLIFIIPVSFIIPYLIIDKKTKKNKFGFSHLLAWLIFVFVGLSWYLYLSIKDPAFFNYFVGHQTIDRFSKNVFNRNEPFWYFPVFSPLMAMPWILVLPYLLKRTKIHIKKQYYPILSGILIPLFFFSLSSSKRILYVLPYYGLLAVFIANLYENLTDKSKTVKRVIFIYSLIFSLAFSIVPILKTDFYIPKYISFISLIFLIIMIFLFKNVKSKDNPIFISSLFSVLLILFATFFISNNQLKSNSLQPVTNFIKKNKLQDRDIFVYNKMLPSVAFGLNKMIVTLNNGSKKLKRETKFEENDLWKRYWIDMRNKSDIKLLKVKLKSPSVLITYKHSPPKNMVWIYNLYNHKKKIGRWIVLY